MILPTKIGAVSPDLTELGLVVRDDGLHDERASIATGHGRGDVQIVSN